MSQNIAGRLELHPDDVGRVAEGVEQYARTYLMSSPEGDHSRIEALDAASEDERTLLAAGCLVEAACLRTLMDQAQAKALWGEAARLYRDLGRSYAVPCAILGEQHIVVREFVFSPEREGEPHHQLLATAAEAASRPSGRARYEAARDRQASARDQADTAPVGELGLPLRLWRGATDAIAFDGEGRAADVLALLERADEQVAIERADVYHWTAPAASVTVVDPEVLALARVAIDAGIEQVSDDFWVSMPLIAAAALRDAK